MSVGKLISVDRNGPGVVLTIAVDGMAEYLVVALDEEAAGVHAVEVLGYLDQPVREKALDAAQRELDAFAGERFVSALGARSA